MLKATDAQLVGETTNQPLSLKVNATRDDYLDAARQLLEFSATDLDRAREEYKDQVPKGGVVSHGITIPPAASTDQSQVACLLGAIGEWAGRFGLDVLKFEPDTERGGIVVFIARTADLQLVEAELERDHNTQH